MAVVQLSVIVHGKLEVGACGGRKRGTSCKRKRDARCFVGRIRCVIVKGMRTCTSFWRWLLASRRLVFREDVRYLKIWIRLWEVGAWRARPLR